MSQILSLAVSIPPVSRALARLSKSGKSRPQVGTLFVDFHNQIAVGTRVKQRKRRSNPHNEVESLDWKWILVVILSVLLLSFGILHINKVW